MKVTDGNVDTLIEWNYIYPEQYSMPFSSESYNFPNESYNFLKLNIIYEYYCRNCGIYNIKLTLTNEDFIEENFEKFYFYNEPVDFFKFEYKIFNNSLTSSTIKKLNLTRGISRYIYLNENYPFKLTEFFNSKEFFLYDNNAEIKYYMKLFLELYSEKLIKSYKFEYNYYD